MRHSISSVGKIFDQQIRNSIVAVDDIEYFEAGADIVETKERTMAAAFAAVYRIKIGMVSLAASKWYIPLASLLMFSCCVPANNFLVITNTPLLLYKVMVAAFVNCRVSLPAVTGLG